MLRNVLWGIVAIVIIAVTAYFVYRRRKKNDNRYYRPDTESEKEVERQIAIEKEKSHRHPPGGKGL